VQAQAAIRQAYRTWYADPSHLRSICGEVTEVADWSVWDEASAAAGNSRMGKTSEAAYGVPSNLSPTDNEEQDPAAASEE
jgi:hypothetical protein